MVVDGFPDNVIAVPWQIRWLVAVTVSAGIGFTVIRTTSVTEQPDMLAVSLYSVVAVGDATGCAQLTQLRVAAAEPDGFKVHAYVTPDAEGLPSTTDAPGHMEASGLAVATRVGVTVTVLVSVQPFVNVISTL